MERKTKMQVAIEQLEILHDIARAMAKKEEYSSEYGQGVAEGQRIAADVFRAQVATSLARVAQVEG